MAHNKPFVASAAIQGNIGFPGKLAEGWEGAIAIRWVNCSPNTGR